MRGIFHMSLYTYSIYMLFYKMNPLNIQINKDTPTSITPSLKKEYKKSNEWNYVSPHTNLFVLQTKKGIFTILGIYCWKFLHRKNALLFITIFRLTKNQLRLHLKLLFYVYFSIVKIPFFL